MYCLFVIFFYVISMLQENFKGLFKGLKNNIYVYKWLFTGRLRKLEDSSTKIQIIIQESLSKKQLYKSN